MLRSFTSIPFNLFFAFSAAFTSTMLTKPNPRERPLPWSNTIWHVSTSPYFSNKRLISRSVVYTESPNTPRHLLGGGASRSPTCLLREDSGERLPPPRLWLRLRLRLLLPLRRFDTERERDFERLRDLDLLSSLICRRFSPRSEAADFDRERDGDFERDFERDFECDFDRERDGVPMID